MADYLVVDRALTETERLRDELERAGIPRDDVLVAHTAHEAVRLFEEHHPSKTVLAIDLPDMGGHEVAKDIWRMDPEVDVVVHTDLDPSDPRVRETVEGGAWTVLKRPSPGRALASVLTGKADGGGSLAGTIPPMG